MMKGLSYHKEGSNTVYSYRFGSSGIIYFYPLQRLKNGGWKGVKVTQYADERTPRKAVLGNAPKSELGRYKALETAEIPKKVHAKLKAHPKVTLESTGFGAAARVLSELRDELCGKQSSESLVPEADPKKDALESFRGSLGRLVEARTVHADPWEVTGDRETWEPGDKQSARAELLSVEESRELGSGVPVAVYWEASMGKIGRRFDDYGYEMPSGQRVSMHKGGEPLEFGHLVKESLDQWAGAFVKSFEKDQ